jgi:hypothetical protein
VYSMLSISSLCVLFARFAYAQHMHRYQSLSISLRISEIAYKEPKNLMRLLGKQMGSKAAQKNVDLTQKDLSLKIS